MGLIRDPAPFYTNSNITGRRATEDDVQKLREVLELPKQLAPSSAVALTCLV